MSLVTRSTARWVSFYALLAAGVMYLIGSYFRFTWGIRDVCRARGQNYDPATAVDDILVFPLSRPCNATYDLVPNSINLAIVALAATTIIFAIIAVTVTPSSQGA